MIGDNRNRPQFPTVAGHFLIWFTSVQFAVLDLDTGGGHDVPLPGAVLGSEAAIVPTTSPGGSPKGPGRRTSVSVLPTASAPAIPACGHRPVSEQGGRLLDQVAQVGQERGRPGAVHGPVVARERQPQPAPDLGHAVDGDQAVPDAADRE